MNESVTRWITILLPILVSLIVVWLGAWLTENRSLRERAWAQKALAYADTFEALAIMGRFLDGQVEDELLRREHNPETITRTASEFRDVHEKMRRSLARQSWLLPPTVNARVEQMEAVFSARYETYFDDVDASAAECGKAESDLRALARADMLGTGSSRTRLWEQLRTGLQ